MKNRSTSGINDEVTDSTANKDIDSGEVHRVLVLQGGGALGAYEAGVYDTLYYWIKKDAAASPTKIRFLML
jgi:hypothetical protein